MSSSRNKNVIIAVVVAAVVVIAAVIALVASGGGDDDNGSSSDTTSVDGGGGAGETQPVTIVGDVLPEFDTPENDTAIGSTAPTLEGFTFDGSAMSIAPGATGRPMMLVFLAHWCPHCNAEIPVLIEWNESGGVPSNLDVIGVSTAVFDDRDNYPPSEWIRDKKFPWPVLADSATSDGAVAYGVTGFPSFALIDEGGKVLYRADGEKTLEEIEFIVNTFFPST